MYALADVTHVRWGQIDEREQCAVVFFEWRKVRAKKAKPKSQGDNLMRAIVVDEKVIVLKHRQETERGCTMRAEKLAEQLGVGGAEEESDPSRDAFNAYMRTNLPGCTDAATRVRLWELWQAARK